MYTTGFYFTNLSPGSVRLLIEGLTKRHENNISVGIPEHNMGGIETVCCISFSGVVVDDPDMDGISMDKDSDKESKE